jgi:hypothetical protein
MPYKHTSHKNDNSLLCGDKCAENILSFASGEGILLRGRGGGYLIDNFSTETVLPPRVIKKRGKEQLTEMKGGKKIN